jgi:non-ribosomal peptide synthase protein (TIGR01720 family)
MNDLMARIASLPPARRQLLDALLQQQRAAPTISSNYVAPRTPVEATLAEIWTSVLGVDRVGIDDNFFELGGDSIHSIQIIARARRAGLRLTNTQLFEHPTIARLSAVAVPVRETTAIAAVPEGDVPLTPIQHWFFAQPIHLRDHWNQTVVLNTPWTMPDEPAVRRAWTAAVARHEALRLRFARDGASWRQYVVDTDTIAGAPATVDLTQVSVASLPPLVDAVVRDTQRSLHLAAGPVVRLILIRRPARMTHLAMVVAHHLVIDAVSCRTLVEELSQATVADLDAPDANERGQGELARQPRAQHDASVSFPAWTRRVVEHASSGSLRAEVSYWQRQLTELATLPVDDADGRNRECDARTCTITLNEADTTALRRARPGGATSAQHLLLAALCRTLMNATGQRRIGLWLEGHGRDDDEIDLSRTVGWLTTLFPVAFESEPLTTPERLLADVRRTLAAIPNKGRGFGLLRYLQPDPAVRAVVAGRGSDVLFNYLGVFDDPRAHAAGFTIENAAPRGQYDPQSERPFALQVYGGIYRGCLVVHWTYSAARHRPDTIASWANAFRDHVRALASRPAADTDLADAVVGDVTLTRADLAAIVAAHERE